MLINKRSGVVLSDDSVSLSPEEIPSPWVSNSGEIAHPESPLGAGGTGFFRTPGSIDGVGKQSISIPQPNTLIGRNHVLSSDEITALQNSKKKPPKKNPPPVTKKDTYERKQKKNTHNVAVDLTISILEDLTEQANVVDGDAHTGIVEETFTAGFSWADVEIDNATAKVTKIDGENILQGKIELLISFALGIKPGQKSAYGRGTTVKDVANGDVTIGFHEHCHLDDWWNYLKLHKLPLEFEGKVGMLGTDYVKKQTVLEDLFQKFIDGGDKLTVEQTDEVGKPTRSEFLKKN